MSPDRLSRLESLYQQTGNPAFCWEAITGCDTPEELPDWVWAYLTRCASNFLAIPSDPSTLGGAVLEALELASNGGPSLIRQAQTQRRREAALDDMQVRIDRGVDPAIASDLVGPLHGYSGPTLLTYYYRRQRVEKSPGELSTVGSN